MMKLPLTFLSLLLCSSLLQADTLPIPSFEAHYEVSRNGFSVGIAKRKLYFQDEQWVFESTSYTTGFAAFFVKDVITERSTSLYQKGRMLPLKYLYQRTGGKRERLVKINFDWEKQRVINSINNDPWAMKIPIGTLDKFVYQLQIMLDLANQQPLYYQVADGGKLKEYQIEQHKEETLKTTAGNFKAVKLVRQKGKRQTILWCAEALHYLPIKITRIEKDGSEYQAELIYIKGFESPPES